MESEEMDANQQLQLLRSSQTSALLAAEVPPSPMWYSVALATVIGGLSLHNETGNTAWLLVGLAAGALVCVHYFPTVTVIPRRSKRTVIGNLAILAVCWALITAWGVVVSTDRLDGNGISRWLTIVGLWVGTSMALATAMVVHDRWRRRAVLAGAQPDSMAR
jgi:hypothetical protein